MEQAFFIEENIKEIKSIIHFCEFSTKLTSSDSNEIPHFSSINEDSKVTEFYRKYGIVSDYSIDLDEGKIFSLVKENLLPEVYCIIGKTYSGKTTIARFLNERMNMKYFDFNEFLNSPQLK